MVTVLQLKISREPLIIFLTLYRWVEGYLRFNSLRLILLFFIEDIKIIPLPVKHGKLDILGYRFGRIAYITDCSHIPESTYDKLEGLDILIIDALRYRPHPTHMNISEALEVIEKTGVSRAYLTHLSHSVEHEETKKRIYLHGLDLPMMV